MSDHVDAGRSINREELSIERTRLVGVLDGLQNVDGKGIEAFGPDASGGRTRIITAETRDALERRLDEIDRKLAELPS